jgi:hypothetical protein
MTTLPSLEAESEAAAFPDAGTDRADWEARGAELGRAASTHAWDVGDWILQGETHFDATPELTARITELDESTLRGFRYVCQRFERVRRRTNLSFGHHREVASLPPDEADALLDRAESDGLTRAQLRALVAAARPPHPETVPTRSELVADLLKDAVGERQRLAALPGGDKVRIAHERYISELEAHLDHLHRLAAEPEFGGDDDRAYPEDVKSGRFGRRV